MKENKIKITSKVQGELGASVVIGKEKYLVQTERENPNNFRIITRIYLKGGILSTIKNDYRSRSAPNEIESKMREFMEQQHRSVIDGLNREKAAEAEKAAGAKDIKVEEKAGVTQQAEAIIEKKEEPPKPVIKSPSDYLEIVKSLLMRKSQRTALDLLDEALAHYPNDPFLLSYYGYLEAVLNKKYKSGIEHCKKAMGLLKGEVPFGEDFFYPMLFLNLGRVYAASGKRKNAYEAFSKGLSMDSGNTDILRELKRLGIRKSPPLSFLKRSNPINKFVGKLFYKK